MDRAPVQFLTMVCLGLSTVAWLLGMICHLRLRALPRQLSRLSEPLSASPEHVLDAVLALVSTAGSAVARGSECLEVTVSRCALRAHVAVGSTDKRLAVDIDFAGWAKHTDRAMGAFILFIVPGTIVVVTCILCFGIVPSHASTTRAYALYILQACHVVWLPLVLYRVFSAQRRRALLLCDRMRMAASAAGT